MNEAERLGQMLRAKKKEVRADAARALGVIGEPALPVLLLALQDPDWVVRYRAVEALGLIKGSRIDGLLLPVLDDPRDHVRYMAAKMLGVRRVPGAAKHLERLLGDENVYVRKSAAKALGEIAVPASRTALEVALHRETEEGVRTALYIALRALRGSKNST